MQRGYSRYKRIDHTTYLNNLYLPFFITAIFLRLLISLIKPYEIDMAGYVAWSNYLASHGPGQFYTGSGFHVVYAPFFLYFLWFTGKLAQIFTFSAGFTAYIIKCWSVLFEFIGSILIIKLSEKVGRLKQGYLVALLYFINPAIFVNSSVWGQFDSIPATMLLRVILMFEYKRPNEGALLFLIAVLTKPQSGLLLPVVLYLYFKDFRFNKEFIKRIITGIILGISLYLIIILPFYNPTSKVHLMPRFLDPFYWLFDLYFRSIQDYPFATANAFNLWTLLGGQIQQDTLPFIGLSYLWWGNILFVLAVVFALICLIKGGTDIHAISYFSYLVQFSAFFFMTKMHERYLLPSIIFIMVSCIFEKRHFLVSILLSVCVFFNHLYLYIISFDKVYWITRWDPLALILAGLTLIVYVLSIYNGYKLFIKKEK